MRRVQWRPAPSCTGQACGQGRRLAPAGQRRQQPAPQAAAAAEHAGAGAATAALICADAPQDRCRQGGARPGLAFYPRQHTPVADTGKAHHNLALHTRLVVSTPRVILGFQKC